MKYFFTNLYIYTVFLGELSCCYCVLVLSFTCFKRLESVPMNIFWFIIQSMIYMEFPENSHSKKIYL